MNHFPFHRASAGPGPAGKKVSRVLSLAVVLFLLTGCLMGKPRAGRDEIAALTRGEYTITNGYDRTISYLTAGCEEGRRVIFVHGTPGNAAVWADFLINPMEGLEFIAVDRPGYGRSTPPEPSVSLRDQASALEPLLVKRRQSWPIVVGYSFGGPVAARLAADYGDRVAGIVIVAGALDPSLENPYLLQRLADWWLAPRLLPRTARTANRELLALGEELRQLQPLLSSVRCPVIVLHGRKDRRVPYANVAYMAEPFHGAEFLEVVDFDHVGHFIPRHAPEAVSRAVTRIAELAEAGLSADRT